MVETADSSVLAQLGWPDMRLPILYTMSWPARVQCSEQTWPRLDFVKMGDLTFRWGGGRGGRWRDPAGAGACRRAGLGWHTAPQPGPLALALPGPACRPPATTTRPLLNLSLQPPPWPPPAGSPTTPSTPP